MSSSVSRPNHTGLPLWTGRKPRIVDRHQPIRSCVRSAERLNPPKSSVRYSGTHIATVIGRDEETYSEACKQLTDLIQTNGGSILQCRTLSTFATQLHLSLLPSHAAYITKQLNSVRIPKGTDIVIQSSESVITRKKVAVFDLDSTLIEQETIDELAAELGLESQVAEITERAMNGDIDFRTSLKQRVSLLQGLSVSALECVKKRIRYTQGAKELITVLTNNGVRTVVISGGFDFLANHVRDTLGLHEAHANVLEIGPDNKLTGSTVGLIVDAEFKRSKLLHIANLLNAPMDSVMAVGDGSNDLLMLESAGLGIAFNAKPAVQKRAKVKINQPSLKNVLYLLGFDDDQIAMSLA